MVVQYEYTKEVSLLEVPGLFYMMYGYITIPRTGQDENNFTEGFIKNRRRYF
jgi:hypothetical protein